MSSVREIVIEHLKAGGFDGLWSSRWDCGCELSDLMPCEQDCLPGCEPGHKIPCDQDSCPADGDCEWHIGPRPEEGESDAV